MTPPDHPARYHAGELNAQRLAGTEDPRAPWSRTVRRTMNEEVMARVAAADLAVVGALDDGGHPWAWPLAGGPGIARPLGPELLRIHTAAVLPLELAWQVARTSSVGVLAIDLRARTRARVNGRGALTSERLAIAVDEAFTNGSRYVHARVGRSVSGARPEIVRRRASLDASQLGLVRDSDTLFIATRSAAGGMDVSHRGGRPGFVSATATELGFTDLTGNGMFQTLGNLVEDERACLLFVGFESGRWLQVLVEAVPRFGAALTSGIRTRHTVTCHVMAVLEGQGLPRRWNLLERSPDVSGSLPSSWRAA